MIDLTAPEQVQGDMLPTLDQLIRRHPYCAAYRMLRCAALANMHSTALAQAVQETAVYLSDRSQLFLLVSGGGYEWVSIMREVEQRRAAGEAEAYDFLLIDRYLEQEPLLPVAGAAGRVEVAAGGTQPADVPLSPDALLASIEAAPVAGDLTGDATPADLADDATLSVIDSFLADEASGHLFTPAAPPPGVSASPAEGIEKIRDRAILSESLAKVYVKQHKYEQALAIFSSLNLRFSEKSSYFADQIRFLEKVIAYQNEAVSPEGNKN